MLICKNIIKLFKLNERQRKMQDFIIFSFFILFYYTLSRLGLKKLECNNMSLIHASICVLASPWTLIVESTILYSVVAKYILLQSIAYFTIDTLTGCDRFWTTHHLGAIYLELVGLIFQQSGGASLLSWTELGAILYHISRIYSHSLNFRAAFVFTYGLTRIPVYYIMYSGLYYQSLNLPQFENFPVWSNNLIMLLIAVMNGYFFVKQFQSWRKMTKAHLVSSEKQD